MKATSYGRYDVFDDETAITWEQAEALALKARGKDVVVPPAPKNVEAIKVRRNDEPRPVIQISKVTVKPVTRERELLNRALILLIHLRERVFNENPEVEKWVNEIIEEAKTS